MAGQKMSSSGIAMQTVTVAISTARFVEPLS